MSEQFRFPSYHNRVLILGRTGSGKTTLGAWLLSQAPFDKQPYIIVDYKRDELLNSVMWIKEISLNEIPTKPGLYIVHPRPDQEAEVEAWLWKIWERKKIGLYFDEAYALPDKGAVRAILTQGRSLRIPVIALSQRPAWLSRFFFSEADFYAVFHLNDTEDRKAIKRFLPAQSQELRLADFHSHWYDVGKDALFHLQPVPDAETIAEMIDARLEPRRTLF